MIAMRVDDGDQQRNTEITIPQDGAVLTDARPRMNHRVQIRAGVDVLPIEPHIQQIGDKFPVKTIDEEFRGDVLQSVEQIVPVDKITTPILVGTFHTFLRDTMAQKRQVSIDVELFKHLAEAEGEGEGHFAVPFD